MSFTVINFFYLNIHHIFLSHLVPSGSFDLHVACISMYSVSSWEYEASNDEMTSSELDRMCKKVLFRVVGILDEIYPLPHEPSSLVCGLQVSLKEKARFQRHGHLTIGLCDA